MNYNVKHFLEQCLFSVQAALKTDGEIIVVDNCSSDNSLAYLQPLFPAVQFIRNSENLGFARACNQGLAASRGTYVLFLNPDTLVPEDCFTRCLAFLRSHPDAGGLGCRMLDGSGRFLRESKRAFPSPMTSLYKLTGLSKLFPHSPVFSRYHLGHLEEKKNNEVDVLAGAFMLIPRKVLDQVGGFDERFFMYGEDVDLSYRIQKAGWKNYYFADTPIIHFKGESTRKSSINYVRMFYQAMSLFVRKHYGGKRAGIFNGLIHLAIWLRAGLSAIGRFVQKIGLPLIDAGLILLSFWLVKLAWTGWVRPEMEYENRLLWIAFPAYSVFFLLTAYYAGLYDKWYRRNVVLHASAIAVITLLAAYSLLPEQYRFSRGIVLFGAISAFLLISLLRYLLVKTGVLSSAREKEEHQVYVVAGTEQETKQVQQLLNEAGYRQPFLGRIAVTESDTGGAGQISNLPSLATMLPFREIIFCQGQLTYKEIISRLEQLPEEISAKIHSKGSHSIIGSDSKDSSGESVSREQYRISDPYNRRLRRLAETGIAIAGILLFPLHIWLVKKPFVFLGRCFRVISGKNSWVGYAGKAAGLPPLRPGIIACNGLPLSQPQVLSAESLQMTDFWYARDYTVQKDLALIGRQYRHLGD